MTALVDLWKVCCAAVLKNCPSRQEQDRRSHLARLRQFERDRISDELNDALLQGIHGLIWKFQALSERLPKSHPVRASMTEALQGADRILIEGRDRVMNLRASANGESRLVEHIKRAVEEITLDPAVRFTAVSRGQELELVPRVHFEVIAIASEALRHAYRRSSARHITLQIFFEPAVLRVRIAHDGMGSPGNPGAMGGLPGRWSLADLKERALAISAELHFDSGAEDDRAVELSVPASVAFGAE